MSTSAIVPFRASAIAASAAFVIALLASGASWAQAAPADPAPVDDEAAPKSKLDTVIVTADRRAESIKRVPSSVTAISGSKLEELGASRIDDFIGMMPGMNFVGGRPGNRLVTLRGVTSGGDQQNATVGTYIDDVPVGSSTTFGQGSRVKPDIDAFDLNRLEVLRGPQGTLYGANTLGGLLKYVTTQPDPKAFSGFGRIEANSVSHGGNGYGFNAGVNAPLTAESALRLTVFSREEGGYIDNVAPGGKKDVNDLRTTGARLAYAITPVKGFNIRASVITQDFKMGGEPTEDVALATGVPTVGEYSQARFTDESSKQTFNLYSLTMELDTANGGKLLSVSSYNDTKYQRGSDYTNYYHLSRNLFLNVPLVNNNSRFGTQKTTQEFRYTSPKSDQFEWIAGLFWTKEDSSLNTLINGMNADGSAAAAPNATILTEETLSTYKQTALYGNARYYITPQFDIGFGLRYTKDTTASNDVTNGVRLDAPQSSNFTSYMLAPRYLLSKDITLFARVATASRPGGSNFLTAAGITGGAPLSFEPDQLTSYEAGIKTTSSDGRFGLDVSAFYIDWKKVQLRTSVNGFFFIGNGGKAKSQGIEAALTANPINPLTLSLNFAYTDATLSEDALVVGGHAGDRLPNTAKLSGGASADYEMAGFAGSQAYVGVSLRHLGARQSNFLPAPRLDLPAFTTLDLRAGLRWDKWDLNFYVKNAADTHAVETITTNFYPGAAAIGRPRTIGMFATFRY